MWQKLVQVKYEVNTTNDQVDTTRIFTTLL